MSMALMGLFIAFSIAYHLAKRYHLPELNASVVSTVVFLIVSSPLVDAVEVGAEVSNLYMPTTFLDAKGIFTAIIVALGSVEIMRFLMEKNIRFKLPQGVPPAIASSFDSIIPIFVCVFIFYGISLLCQNITGELIPSFIMKILAPAVSGLDSLLGICLITMIAQIFWFFGLHGASITQPIRLPFMQLYLCLKTQ